MPDPTAERTLVKSPPELWAEVSDAGSLAAHLGAFGDIRITRLDAEATTVAWEGDRARGTVELEASGWGTRVRLTAQDPAGQEPADVKIPPPDGPPRPAARPSLPVSAPDLRRAHDALGGLLRLRAAGRPPRRRLPTPAPTGTLTDAQARAVLLGALDGLGAARRRPA